MPVALLVDMFGKSVSTSSSNISRKVNILSTQLNVILRWKMRLRKLLHQVTTNINKMLVKCISHIFRFNMSSLSTIFLDLGFLFRH